MNGIWKITDLGSLKNDKLVLLDDELRWHQFGNEIRKEFQKCRV